MHEITYTLTRGDQTVTLDVEYDVAAYDPGSTWGLPEDSEPPSGDALEQHIYETHDYSDDGYDPDMDDRTWSSD